MNSTFIVQLLDTSRRLSDKLAIVDHNGKRSTTYGELLELALKVAGYIKEKDFAPGTFIAVRMPSCMEYLAAEMGIWLSRCAAVPLGDTFPQQRVNYIVGHCESPMVIDGTLMDTIRTCKPAEADIPKRDDTALLMYTSGSTGEPKGIVITFDAMDWGTPHTMGALTEESVFGSIIPFHFMVIQFLYDTLLVGGTTHLYSRDVITSPDRMADYIAEYGITVCYLPPALLRLFHNHSNKLKTIFCTGDKLVDLQPTEGYTLINMYGMTELAGPTLLYEVPAGQSGAVPVGRPKHDVECRVIDDDGCEVPQGEVGELCLKGHFCKGYYKNPEQTEALYRGGWLHTGDLVWQDAEGLFHYINRKDFMVKINGQRVEPGEVETVIKKVPGVSDAVVKGFDNGEGSQYLCAYFISDSVAKEELRSRITEFLPEYMVPSAFVQMDVMPLNPNGKIDRKSLPEPEYKAENIVLPATKDEQQVLEIVEDLMGLSPISVIANLISLGLSSIAAMRLSMRISKDLGKSITMSQLMSAPTVRDIAANLCNAEHPNFGRVRQRQKYYPLTDNQIGVYLDWEQHRDGLQYNIPYVLKLKGYDAERLKTAVETVVAAHPYLKARLAVVDAEVMIQRRDEDRYEYTVTELDSEPDTAFFQSSVRPFDLFNDSLCRFEIYTYGECLYLFLDIHHIISDGLSEARLMAEIFRAYRGDTIEPETFTAFDRAIEEYEIKESEAYTSAKEYYTDLLSGLESTAYPHSTAGIGEGKAKCVSGSLGRNAIEEHCAHLGITPSNYLLTVFLEVLKRITREDKVLITIVNSGREHSAMQNIQGFFVKTLPVVSADTVAEVQSQLIESISHECYPLTEMVQSLGIRPEIMYAYEGGLFEGGSDITRDKGIEIISLSLDTVKAPTLLTVTPDDNDFGLTIEYDDSLYNEADMETLLRSIINLARNYAKTKDCYTSTANEAPITLQDCSLLTSEEEQCLIALGTGETLEYDRSKTFIDLFQEQTKKTPDAVAIVYKDKQLTYRELDSITDRLAVKLHSLGVEPEVTVGVLIDRSELMAVYPLAIMKSGGAYMPLDPTFPEERLLYMCNDAGLSLILSDEGLAEKVIPSFDGKIIESSVFDTLSEVTDEDLNQLPKARPENKYVVLYTSGSTGRPKGVVLEHHSIVNFCHWYVKDFAMTSADKALAHANFGFDAHMMDFYPALICGASVYVLPSELRLNLPSVNRYMNETGISIAYFTTLLGQLFVSTMDNHSLRLLSLGGEKLNATRKPTYRLVNGYGPTECTVYSSFYEIGSDYDSNIIGRPLSNTRIFIADKEMRLVPEGSIGELVISGEGVSRGYLNENLTAERFVSITVGDETIKVYKTGDLCRWNADGQLEYIGRIDSQIKLRGFRIELGEIESAALQIDGVKQAVAMVKNEQIVLYYTADDSLDDTIRQSILSSLPEYMAPSVFIHLDSMPLTPNGKIDRKTLPEPEIVQEEYVAPRNEIERVIADTFKEVLNLNNEVGVTSRFYGLGGDSIKSIRLVSLLSQKGYRLSVSDVMKLQTPEALAPVVVSADAEEEFFSITLPIEKRYPLTPMQEAMLLKQLSEPDSWGYRLVFRYRLNAVPSEHQLRAVLDALAVEHETLRTRIIYKDVETPEQEITERQIPLSIEDIRETGRTIKEIHTEQLNRGFDLEEDPLMRVMCIITGENECQLLIAMHHIIIDGWSLPIYLGHLFQHLKDAIEGREISVAETDEGLFEQHVRSLMLRDKDESLGYWKELLEGYETKAEIKQYNEIDNGNGNDHLNIALDQDQTERLKAVCAANGATLSHATELAWGMVLQRYTRLDDVVFAKVVSCRDKAPVDMSNVVGPFINSIPVRIKIDGTQTLAKSLQAVSSQAAQSNAHDYCSLSEIQQQSELGSNLFQSILAFENYPVSDEIRRQFNGSDNALHIEALDNQEESYNDIALAAYEKDGQLQLNLTFDKEKFSETDMQSVLSSWWHVLVRTAESPESRISEVGLLTDKEEQRLIALGTGGTLEYDRSKSFIDLFREQAAKTPDAVAVVDKNSQLTYRELDRASDEYAKTVTPGTFVCLEMPRVKEFVVAVLGIWKAGAAYTPIDTEYPEERKKFMREESDGKSMPQPDIAYMIYTSGSTGKPKGVMIRHSGLTNYIVSVVQKENLTEYDKIAAYRSFSFDSHIEDLYPVLSVGGTLYIIPEECRKDSELLNGYIVQNGIRGIGLPTQMAKLLLDGFHPSSLRFITAGGEKLDNIYSPSIDIINEYGPTECTVEVSYYIIQKGKRLNTIPIGRPLPNTLCFIVDSFNHILPYRCAGELVVAGPQLALGYWNNPELTAERFIDIPVGGKTIKVYKTGDLCRWNADGQLEYIGRIDNQIKLRGFRIELGEIEDCIASCPGVKQACVTVNQINASRNLVCYYISESGDELDVESVKEYSRIKLAEFMIPAFFVRMDSFPVNANGKIDRKKLPLPTIGTDASEYVEPKGHFEKTIASHIGEVLALDKPVSALDSFTYLGGTSLDAIKLLAILHREGIECTIGQILKFRNIREMAIAADYAVRKEYVDRLRPLYPAQIRIFNDFLYRPDSFENRKGIIMDVDTSIDDGTLLRVIGEWGERHPELTSSIAYVGIDNPMHVFLSGRQIPLHIYNLADEDDPRERMQDFETELKLNVSQLQIAPLVQVLFGRVSEAENYLLVVFHSIIAEQWRIRSCLADLVGSLAAGQRCSSSLDEWQYILSGYERHVDMQEREDWSKETGCVSVTNPRQITPSDGKDNFFEYHREVNRPTLVFVHTGNTGVEAYAPLAARLKGVCSFAVLDQWNLYHQDNVIHGIPDIARKYIEVLKSHQPDGPYYLGGWCYGGMVAYEMACQLKKSGEDVPALIMLDAFCSKDKLWKRSMSDQRNNDMTDYFTNSPLFADLIARNMLDAMLRNSTQVCADMLSFKPQQYDGNVLYFKSAVASGILGPENTDRCTGSDLQNAGGFEGYICPKNLALVKVEQKHDDMMNGESLDIEVPRIIEAILKNHADR